MRAACSQFQARFPVRKNIYPTIDRATVAHLWPAICLLGVTTEFAQYKALSPDLSILH